LQAINEETWGTWLHLKVLTPPPRSLIHSHLLPLTHTLPISLTSSTHPTLTFHSSRPLPTHQSSPLTTLSTHLHSHTHPLTNRPLKTFSTHAHPHLPLLFLPSLVLALDLLRGEGVDVGAPRMLATQLWTRPCQTT